MDREGAIQFIVSRLLAGERELDRLKREAAMEFHLDSFIKNPDILAAFPKDRLSPDIRDLLLKKPVKTLSGVTPVAVMIAPQGSCSHGCIYCPFTGKAAKSYTGLEPAAMRSIQHGFDPYYQVYDRVHQLASAGHPTDKCEVIVMGGTFLETSPQYKSSFVQGIYDGLNARRSKSLEEAMARNERAEHRAIGLTIETRPDACIPYIDEMLSYGTTRVELGVQHADDGIYKIINRGHTASDVLDATRELKDAAFKVLYHVMPGLPASGMEKDIDFVKKLFRDPGFRPDMLKFYPTLVIEGTALHEMMERGEYTPYTAEEAAEVISEFYRYIPKYVRVMRIQRDIPAHKIEKGVKKSNLRELVEQKMLEKGIKADEIRCREVGLKGVRPRIQDLHLQKLSYVASGAEEFFLSFETAGSLLAGFIRLRLPENSARPEIDEGCALIRELHVYGSEASLHEQGKMQHQGLGSRLLEEAESLAMDKGREKMIIISGVGVREYYKKHGYSRLGPYMARAI